MLSGFGRLYRGETRINFFGRRRVSFLASGIVLVVAVISLFFQGLKLGMDFKGGLAFEAPVSGTLTVDSAAKVIRDAGMTESDIKIQMLSSGDNKRVRIQMGVQTSDVQKKVQAALSEASKVTIDEISVSSVSSSWGRSITIQAIQALFVFLGVIALFIAWRFEWRMALSALAALIHDLGISVGVYSFLQLEVTPATVVAFLTIMGFSLYDTIVVFDKVHDNNARFSGSKVSYGDIVNISMNQVLMRSLNTSIAALLPVISILVLGAWVLGAVALEEFALALLIGLSAGTYSSIYIAAPLLGVLKERTTEFVSMRGHLSLGADMSHLMKTGTPIGRRAAARLADALEGAEPVSIPIEALLSHPPRPRKKTRR